MPSCHKGKHGKDGKHQPDDIKHFINDSKHYNHDSKYSICQEDGSKTIFTLRHLWRRLNMGEHDPESAQDERTSSKMWSPELFINLNMRDLKGWRFNPVSKLET